MNFRKFIKFARSNYFILIFVTIVAFVMLIAGYRIFFSKPTYVYARVKVGQGLWWAVTAKPNIWFVSSVKKGDVAKNLTGQPQAQILDVRAYPSWTPQYGTNQYDLYLVLKLRAGLSKRTEEYTFNRSTLSVGSPIELQFPKINITGTVIDLQKTPFQERYVDKIVYLVNQGGYGKDFSYRFDNIKVGDRYFDGNDYVFEILDKSLENNIWTIANNLNAQVYERPVYTTQNIVVKAKVRLKQKKDGLYYNEDYKVAANAFIPFATQNYFFENFVVRKVE